MNKIRPLEEYSLRCYMLYNNYEHVIALDNMYYNTKYIPYRICSYYYNTYYLKLSRVHIIFSDADQGLLQHLRWSTL